MHTTTWPEHLLSLADFEQLPEDNSRDHELRESVLRVAPKPTMLHRRVVAALARALDSRLAEEWEALFGVEVVLVPHWPPTVRVPDVVVTRSALIDRNPPRVHARDVLLAVEVRRSCSSCMDCAGKRHEYARAGIPFHWIVDLGDEIRLSAHRLVDGHYEVDFEATGVVDIGRPFDMSLDLDALGRRGHVSRI